MFNTIFWLVVVMVLVGVLVVPGNIKSVINYVSCIKFNLTMEEPAQIPLATYTLQVELAGYIISVCKSNKSVVLG